MIQICNTSSFLPHSWLIKWLQQSRFLVIAIEDSSVLSLLWGAWAWGRLCTADNRCYPYWAWSPEPEHLCAFVVIKTQRRLARTCHDLFDHDLNMLYNYTLRYAQWITRLEERIRNEWMNNALHKSLNPTRRSSSLSVSTWQICPCRCSKF